jgi:hypothetical protein
MRKKNLHAHQGSANGKVYLPDIHAYQKRFIVRHNEIHSWRKVALPYGDGLKPNMARLIANGYDPGNKIRGVLRLPDKQAFEVCKECGKTLTKYHDCKTSPRSPRIAVSKTDMKRAAASILNNVDPELVKELVEILDERNGG